MFKNIKTALTGFAASVLGLIGSAQAAVPVAVTDEMASMKADAITVASTFLVAFIAIVAFNYMRKPAK